MNKIANNEIEARRMLNADGMSVHFIVSIAVDYSMINSREAFYASNGRIQAAIVRQMTPIAQDIWTEMQAPHKAA